MRIAIDGSKAINESAGIGRYTHEIIKNLINFYPQDDFFVYFNFLRGKEGKLKKINNLIDGKKNVVSKIYSLPGWLKERFFASPWSISNFWVKGSDIFHATEFLSFDNGLRIPQVLTVHDLTMIKFPQQRGKSVSYRHGEMLKRACQNTTKIISVSDSTKNDIIKYFGIKSEKIKTIYSGIDPIYHKIIDRKAVEKFLNQKYHIRFPFILFVSTIEPRKNISNLLKAFDKFAGTKEGTNYNLILVGKKGWNTEETEATYQRIKNKNKVRFMDFVPTEDLVYFYNGADLFCYPSLYEGFGLPVLEAMACGVPVLTSNISSLPEVGGKAAEYADPNSFDDIYKKMNEIIANTKKQQEMSKLGIEQAKKFSWEECAKETHQVYEEVLKNV